MSSPILFMLVATLPFSFLLSLSNLCVANASNPSSNSLIKEACTDVGSNITSKFCIQVLESEPQIASANNPFDLSIEIMESGISNATKTNNYLKKLLKKPNLGLYYKGALRECNSSYNYAIGSFKSALSEVRDMKEYQTATYDLLIASTDNINVCGDAVAKAKIKDRGILNGNKFLKVFGLSAFQVVNHLMEQSGPPPSSS